MNKIRYDCQLFPNVLQQLTIVSYCRVKCHFDNESDLTIHVRGPNYSSSTYSISWLLIPSSLASAGHEHPWPWLCRMDKSYIRGDFNYPLHVNVEQWHKLYSWSRVGIWNVNVRGRQHWFSTYERMFLWKCRRFRDRKYIDLSGRHLALGMETRNRKEYLWWIAWSHRKPNYSGGILQLFVALDGLAVARASCATRYESLFSLTCN